MGDGSLATEFLTQAGRWASQPVFLKKTAGRWEKISWDAAANKVKRAAAGLEALGFREGDRLGILSENRPEWAIVDLACLFLGGVDVPLYLASPTADLAYVLRDAGVTFIAVSGQEQMAKILAVARELPDLFYLLMLDDGPREETRIGRLRVLGLEGLLALGERGEATRPAGSPDVATIIYTSGTTGRPKGVMLTHANLLADARASASVLPVGEGDLAVSVLPLSHAFERVAGLYTMLLAGASIAYGGGPATLVKDFGEVSPTVLCCAPRLLEVIYRRICRERQNVGLLRPRIVEWSVRLGKRAGCFRSLNQPLPWPLTVEHRVADRLLFRRVRALLGGRVQLVICGGAPLDVEIARFFHGAGVPVFEGYGLTEAGPVVSCNRPGRTRLGTVGLPLPQVEVKVAPDGELFVRGPNVMRGYYKREAETLEAIDAEGWLHTGDLGRIDAEGFITITDRKKDLIITSDGENVAPQPIEGRLKQDPLIEDACLVGDKRPYLTVLVVPDRDVLQALARKQGIDEEWPQLLKRGELRAMFRRSLNAVNRDLPRHARARSFVLLEEPFSQERGELTPTLKVRRAVVEKTRRAEIEALYDRSRFSKGEEASQ